MKKLSSLFICLLALSLSATAIAKKHHHKTKTTENSYTIVGAENLTAHINEIIRTADSSASIGIQIKSMKTGETLYGHNEHQLFTPASILKILTAEAALAFLGPNYKFSTTVATNAASTTNGVIEGDVYLVHSGDPSLTFTDLTDLMANLKTRQIQEIRGNVYVDNTAYDQDNIGPGWLEQDEQYCYAAPINASIINHNCISFGILPAKNNGQAPILQESPHYFYADINNSAVTRNARSCHLSLTSGADNTITINGCMPKGKTSRGASFVIANIVKYNQDLLKSLLKHFGIQVTGGIGAKAAPSNSAIIAAHESKPLHVLVTNMLKKSDNIIAGSLFKKIGETYTKQPGSWKNGSTSVKQVLAEKAAVNTSQMNLIDGSGLSPDNQVTPAQMMQVLDYAFHNYATNYEFVSALPISGVDGTLKYRLANVHGKVRAKTGTLAKSGVASLAGYAVSKNKEPIAFVIIVNGQNGNVWQYREIEDKIVTALTNYIAR